MKKIILALILLLSIHLIYAQEEGEDRFLTLEEQLGVTYFPEEGEDGFLTLEEQLGEDQNEGVELPENEDLTANGNNAQEVSVGEPSLSPRRTTLFVSIAVIVFFASVAAIILLYRRRKAAVEKPVYNRNFRHANVAKQPGTETRFLRKIQNYGAKILAREKSEPEVFEQISDLKKK